LEEEGLPEEKRIHYANIIEAESRRLSSLSENLLKLSSLDDSKMQPASFLFRLDKQLETVALTLEPQWAAKNIRLEAELEKCTLAGDSDLLLQVWNNLLHNAIKFTPEGGLIAITQICEDSEAVVTIRDTGVGIAAADQMHVFERFFKADKARDRSLGGNGLGLSIVKRIVDLHGGQVTVTSELGEGTAFTVILPMEPEKGIETKQ
jgi:signal transduction histidine kinase